ncbi:class I SAM-dependent methyltransferase [Pelosinus sp. sgz500959]|uniref:class I SAM-dependent methyltransferase n=1 Tax=Pelosinus sp. sgz500959 TaxID=3242472 RepID=UPI0036702355
MNDDKILMERAISSANLESRSGINNKYALNDFNGFIGDILNNINFKSVLDICCGTGNQIMHYIERPNTEEIVGVDISAESLMVARKRITGDLKEKNVEFICTPMEKMFFDSGLIQRKFDLISCHYGLYYSRSVVDTLKECYQHLNQEGTILIVGPYGENNHQLFRILEKYTKIPDFVKYSSGDFMASEVSPLLTELGLTFQEYKFENEIRYPSVDAVLSYWKASTFYDEQVEEKFSKRLEATFAENASFNVSKHVIAYVAKKIL